MTSDRATRLMKQIWHARENGADTEEKLVAVILRLAADTVKCYNANNGLEVLDRQDLINLTYELDEL